MASQTAQAEAALAASADSALAGDQLADQAAPLDALLVDAALGTYRRFAPDMSAAKLAVALARRPRATGRRMGGLAAELVRIGAGTSSLAPATRDRRFADPAWTQNPVLRRIVQAYLAAGRIADELVGEAGLGSRDERRVRFGVENLIGALSPSNLPLVNPTSAKAAIDTGGLNFIRGGTAWRGTWRPHHESRKWWTGQPLKWAATSRSRRAR
jgi:polyhydroxyalkanoate synthase subunit PhaC